MSTRTALAGLVAAGVLASCASSPPAPPAAPAAPVVPIVLKNPGFEEPMRPGANCATGWACSAHVDTQAFRFFHDESQPANGARSFCIEPVGHEPWATASQVTFDVDALRGTHARFSAAVRLEKVTGEGAGPFAYVQGGQGQVIAKAESFVTGSHGWQRVVVELDVPRTAALVEVGLTLTGKGTACIDDVRLEVTGPARGPV